MYDRINDVANEITEELAATHRNIDNEMNSWLSKKSAPEQLNLEAKQHVLKQKLKWERMFTSRDKLRQLKKVMRRFKRKR
jgi:hypothetical protein